MPNTKDEAKAAGERAVFREFVTAAGLSVPLASIESRKQPEPDILCEHAGELVAFELGRIDDQRLMHTMALAVRNPDNSPGTAFDDPTLELARKKLASEYVSQHPMELLLWGEIMSPPDVWAARFATPLRALFDASASPFRRMWVVNLGRDGEERGPVWLVHPPGWR